MNKIVTIITLNGFFNYGNRLQLFALSKIINEMGYDVSVYWQKGLSERFKQFIKYKTPICLFYKKETKFNHFTEKYTPKLVSYKDCFCSVVGSDQVWNPNYFEVDRYLLDAAGFRRKISYAASVGTESFTSEQKRCFKEALKGYSAISVRERSAQRLLQPLVNKKIDVTLDPTLLLDSCEYEQIEKKPRTLSANEKFVLCYFLGNQDYLESISEYANSHNCRMIFFSDKKGSNYGIEEFLYLVHHAELVCTDSFHASVFSFIFDRPFVVFRRSGEANYMYSRLQNFINTFNIKDREYNGESITIENLKVDSRESKKILIKEREKSLRYLRNALRGRI